MRAPSWQRRAEWQAMRAAGRRAAGAAPNCGQRVQLDAVHQRVALRGGRQRGRLSWQVQFAPASSVALQGSPARSRLLRRLPPPPPLRTCRGCSAAPLRRCSPGQCACTARRACPPTPGLAQRTRTARPGCCNLQGRHEGTTACHRALPFRRGAAQKPQLGAWLLHRPLTGAAIGQLDRVREVRRAVDAAVAVVADKLCVDVDLRHVIHNARNLLRRVLQHVAE